MTPSPTPSWLAGLLALLLLAACGGPSGAPTTTAPTTSSTAPSPPEELFGRMAGFDLDSGALTLEPAEMLSGEEARRAAVEAGVIAEGEDLPNDFFIRDLGADRTVRLTEETQIRLQGYDSGGSPTLVEGDLEGFAQAYAGGFAPPEWYGGEYVEVTVVGDTVTTLQQVYLP